MFDLHLAAAFQDTRTLATPSRHPQRNNESTPAGGRAFPCTMHVACMHEGTASAAMITYRDTVHRRRTKPIEMVSCFLAVSIFGVLQAPF
jgi:hypothetical protein